MSSRDIEERIAYLELENAKLLEEFDNMDIWHSKELLYAISENDRLRELVRSLYKFSYDECPDSTELNFADELHELGVDVDR